jgi:phosphoglycolate phosphatase
MKRLILYDLDGTLVDSLEDIAQAVNHTLSAFSVAALPSQEIRRYVGRGLRELLASCLNNHDHATVEQASERFLAYYAHHLADHTVLYPGVPRLLEYFTARRQAVITNKPTPHARELLRRLGIDRYFFRVIAADDGFPKKPDPAATLALMTQEGIAPEETLLIGDSPIDVETGRRASVVTAVIAQGFSDPEELAAAAPDLLVHHCDELLEYIRAHHW